NCYLRKFEDESAYADLIMILRKQSEVSQNSASKEDAMNSTKSINATLEKLSARVAALEQSLKSQAHGDLNVQTIVSNEEFVEKVQGNPNEAGDNRHIIPMQLEFLLLSKEYPQMNRNSNLLPAITESILRFLLIEEAFHVPTDRAELTDVSESSDGAESSDGERMFDQPSKKKKLKQLT
ncbi:hypothetical protein Tco_0834556, partial [Tanacetum coccineum]